MRDHEPDPALDPAPIMELLTARLKLRVARRKP
jgi:hypothetical protein